MYKRIEKLIQLGFTEQQIKEMERKFNNVLKLTPERLELAFQNIIKNGFTHEDTIAILVNTPSVFGKSIETITNQIELYKKIFRDAYVEKVLDNPRRFIQGYQKTFDRYQVLTKIGVENREQLKDIFLSEKQFINKYKMK